MGILSHFHCEWLPGRIYLSTRLPGFIHLSSLQPPASAKVGWSNQMAKWKLLLAVPDMATWVTGEEVTVSLWAPPVHSNSKPWWKYEGSRSNKSKRISKGVETCRKDNVRGVDHFFGFTPRAGCTSRVVKTKRKHATFLAQRTRRQSRRRQQLPETRELDRGVGHIQWVNSTQVLNCTSIRQSHAIRPRLPVWTWDLSCYRPQVRQSAIWV